MNVKEVVASAKKHAQELLEGEALSGFQLEEVAYNDTSGVWDITLGYYVRDSKPMSGLAATVASLQGGASVERKYKIFRIRDEDGKFLSMKIREG